MGTQMTSARRGIPTEEMVQVAKDEDIDIKSLNPKSSEWFCNYS